MLRSANPSLVAVAIALCGVGGYLLFSAPHGNQANSETTAYLLVANQAIPPQSIVKAEQFSIEQRPVKYIPQDVLANPKEVIGRRSRIGIVAGEPLQESKLFKRGESSVSALPIPTGKRAVTVAVDEVVGVAGFLQPGSCVDVLATWDNGDGEFISKVILQRIFVLAIAQETTPPGSTKPKVTSSVTLAVVPSDAEKLILASDHGKLRLALRDPDEAHTLKTAGINTRVLGGGARVKESKVAKAPVPIQRPEVSKVVSNAIPHSAPQGAEILVYRGTQADRIYR